MARAPRKRAKAVADPTTAYARAVVEGSIIAGPHVRHTCQRHLDDLRRGAWLWDVEAAAHALGFFPDVLRLAGGKHQGEPFHLLPWQAFIVGSLHGWKDPEDGTRRFRVAYVESGKGSGKTPLAAGLGILALSADGEASAEVYAAAATKDQADVAFRAAVSMVKQSPILNHRLHLSGGDMKETGIADIATSSFFRKIAADSPNSGYLVHFAIVDEVHEHRNSTVIDMLEAGQKGRAQPLILMITNTGASKIGPCYSNHAYAEKVVRGDLQDDRFFAYMCALDPDDDPFADESCWAKANPSLGHTLTVEYLRDRVSKARGMPSMEGVVRRLNFCEWTDAAEAWIDRDLWEAAEEDFDPDYLVGLPCRAGLDLSSKRDLTALTFAWRLEDGSLKTATFQWRPADTLDEAARQDNVPYRQWVEEGHLFTAPGRMIDKRIVALFLMEMCAKHDMRSMAYDQALMDDFLAACDDVGLEAWIDDRDRDENGVPDGPAGQGLRLVRHGQGFAGYQSRKTLWMPRSIGALEDAIVNGGIKILRNPLLRWNSASAVLLPDPSGNRKWDKRKSNGRIDGMVSLSEAVGSWAEPEPENAGSIWDDPDFLAALNSA
jgi:phage terminase large subunit-like protein